LWGAVVGGGEVTTVARVSPFIAQSFKSPTESKQKKVLFSNQCPVAFNNEYIGLISRLQHGADSGSGAWPVRLLCDFRGTCRSAVLNHPLTNGVFSPAIVLQQTMREQCNKLLCGWDPKSVDIKL
jgi:hypothetical protein